MEKALVMGCACVVVSSLTPQEIDRFNRYDPDALVLRQEGEPVFSIRMDDGPGSLLEDAANYSRTVSADGKATITILLDPDAEDKAALVRKNVGASLLKLDELEKQIAGRIEHLQEMETAAGSLISQM